MSLEFFCLVVLAVVVGEFLKEILVALFVWLIEVLG